MYFSGEGKIIVLLKFSTLSDHNKENVIKMFVKQFVLIVFNLYKKFDCFSCSVHFIEFHSTISGKLKNKHECECFKNN